MDPNEIKNRIEKVKSDLGTKETSETKDKTVSPLGLAMKMGTEFVAAVFVASFIGFYIDKWLETTPIFIIIFLLSDQLQVFLMLLDPPK